MSSDAFTEIHAATTRMGIHDVVRELVSHLGGTLVATLANVRDRKLPYKWQKVDGPVPQAPSQARLLAAHQIWTLLAQSDGNDVARAWFIGANPRLDDVQPFMALRNGQLAEVVAAARAFRDGTDA